MTVKDIIQQLEAVAPPKYQEGYDNAGLITGQMTQTLTGVMLCLDSTEAVLDEAIANNCNLVVAHHPIVFGGLKRFNGRNYVERVVIKAIQHNIAIYAIHTNLDNMLYQGVNSMIGRKLGLQNLRILDPKRGTLRKLYTYVPVADADKLRNALFGAGAGHVGQYEECSFNTLGAGTFKAGDAANPYVGEKGQRHTEAEFKIEVLYPVHLEGRIMAALRAAHPYEEIAYEIISIENANQEIGAGMVGQLPKPVKTATFLKQLKENMQTSCVRHTQVLKPEVQTIAFCGGAGSFLLDKAIAAQADVFITGDYKYHQFFDADNQIVIADIGHFESEQFTIELLYEIITVKFPTFAVFKTTVNTNPVIYL